MVLIINYLTNKFGQPNTNQIKMKFTIKVTEKIETEKEIDIPMPFYFHDKTIFDGGYESTDDIVVCIWGYVYEIIDEWGNNVIRSTIFERKDSGGGDESEFEYKIESETIGERTIQKCFEYWSSIQCTKEDFNRESSRIFKSITNQ